MKRYIKSTIGLCLLSLLFISHKSVNDNTVIKLNSDEFNVLMGHQGSLEGSIKYGPNKGNGFSEKDNDIVYGFTDVNDKITWTVEVPETADYLVAIQYTGKEFQGQTPDCTVEIISNGKVLSTALRGLTQYNESRKVAGTRQWFDEVIPLKKGINTITFHFSEISSKQIKAAKEELDNGIPPKSSASIAVKDIALVRPKVWNAMKVRAKELKPDLSWMRDGKYGLFIHWSLFTYPLYGDKQAFETFEWGVNTFDVDVFADLVAETGASWVTFTTCHGMQMFPAPIKTLEKVLPGRTTERDLIADLAEALNKRDIKLLLYYNMSPRGELAAKLGIEENPDKWFQYLNDFAREVSLRYGKSIAGWGYIDSSFSAYVMNMPWEKYYRSLKAGNPDAVVAISSHWWAQYSPFNDLQTSDSGGSLNNPLDKKLFEEGGRYEGLQEHSSFVLDGSWFPKEPFNGIIRRDSNSKGGPTFSEQEYLDYFHKMAKANVPVTVNMLITQDVTRDQPFVNPKSLEFMKKVKIALGK
ncbi:alpha-L-fucosidase [Arenibacter echinorum]|uniref:alpha-L-fucosidase n=1 Tax=Arenibacter echinorum TaxID=440515 RepID=A0A327R273_9FLAO|nr:alpha-L-fucosidase [Arenibacter echinorum]RAJ07997.1 alpha-L-fucosidase-like protein [Arenibacter echinorum]